MVSPILMSTSDPATVNATEYNVLQGVNLNWNATEAQVETVFSEAGTIDLGYAACVTAPGAGQSNTFTLRINEADTALVIVISGAGVVTGNDTTHSVTVAAGDRGCWKCVSSATAAAMGANTIGCRFTHANTNTQPILGCSGADQQTANTTQYYTLQGNSLKFTTENTRRSLIPTPGTFSRLFVSVDATPGVGQTYTLTVYLNGAPTALTVQLVNGDTAKSDTTHSFAVVATDVVSLECISSLVGIVTPRLRWGCTFAPTTDGESIGLSCNQSQIQNSTNFRSFTGSNQAGNATEDNRKQVMIACVVKKLYALDDANIGGSGQTQTIRSRVNKANGNLLITINSGSASGNDTGNSDTLVNGDFFDISIANSATTGTTNFQGGIVYYIAPVSSGRTAKNTHPYSLGINLGMGIGMPT